MNATQINGRPQRKTLASQLDRLDGILDALSDGLNEAVATVVEKAVREAVTEVLAHPELRSLLSANAASKPSLTQRLGGWCSWLGRTATATWNGVACGARQTWTWTASVVRRSFGPITEKAHKAWQSTTGVVQRFWMRMLIAGRLAMHLRKPLVMALGIGLTLGVGSYLAGPVIASTLNGLAGFVGTLVASAMAALRRLLAPDEQVA